MQQQQGLQLTTREAPHPECIKHPVCLHYGKVMSHFGTYQVVLRKYFSFVKYLFHAGVYKTTLYHVFFLY